MANEVLEDHCLVRVCHLPFTGISIPLSVSGVKMADKGKKLTVVFLSLSSTHPLCCSCNIVALSAGFVCCVSIWTAFGGRNTTQQACAQLFSSLWCVLTNELIKTVCSNVLKNQNQPNHNQNKR